MTIADNWLFFSTKSLLGSALAGQHKFDEAEQLLLEGFAEMQKREDTIPPNDRQHVTDALQRLIDFFTAWNKPAEAVRWRLELEKRRGAE